VVALLTITNHHRQEAPLIEEAPGRYIGYFCNLHGEQWLFVRERGATTAELYGGDVSWKPVELSARDFSQETRRQVHGAPVVGRDGEAVILDEPEMLWLAACWFASNIS
jgi:hypothetical protein